MRDGPRAATMMDLSSKEYAMRSYCPRSVLLTLGFVLAGSASTMAFGQEFGSPKLLPISSDDYYTASLAAHQDAVVVEAGDYHRLVNPVGLERVELPVEQSAAVEVDQALRPVVDQVPEPRPLAGGKNDRFHASRLPSKYGGD